MLSAISPTVINVINYWLPCLILNFQEAKREAKSAMFSIPDLEVEIYNRDSTWTPQEVAWDGWNFFKRWLIRWRRNRWARVKDLQWGYDKDCLTHRTKSRTGFFWALKGMGIGNNKWKSPLFGSRGRDMSPCLQCNRFKRLRRVIASIQGSNNKWGLLVWLEVADNRIQTGTFD